MDEDKLYVPGDISHPVVEMFFKHAGIVHGIRHLLQDLCIVDGGFLQ
jgi:hypothetical protein